MSEQRFTEALPCRLNYR